MKPAAEELNRKICGEGPPLVLLHGVTRRGADWDPLVPVLSSRWRVIAPDQRGHGDSPRGSRYLVTDYAADAVRMVEQELEVPVVIFGHSLGAMVAAAVAAALPDLVRGIVLEDPPFHAMGNRISGTAWEAQFIGMRAVARQGGSLTEMTDALASVQLPTSGGGFRTLGELRDRSSLAWSAECLAKIDAELLTPIIEGRWLEGYDFPAILSQIRCPALLLQADPAAGGALTDGDAEAACLALSTCRHVRFPGCGHQLHRDRPEAVLQAFAEFTAPWEDAPEATRIS
jgi:pimeloyl-ACP methyl ester carboxylesterase